MISLADLYRYSETSAENARTFERNLKETQMSNLAVSLRNQLDTTEQALAAASLRNEALERALRSVMGDLAGSPRLTPSQSRAIYDRARAALAP